MPDLECMAGVPNLSTVMRPLMCDHYITGRHQRHQICLECHKCRPEAVENWVRVSMGDIFDGPQPEFPGSVSFFRGEALLTPTHPPPLGSPIDVQWNRLPGGKPGRGH
eukprot:s3_g47.t1